MNLVSKIEVDIQIEQKKTFTGFGTDTFNVHDENITILANGQASGQADVVYHATRTITNADGGADETLNFHDASLKDCYGDTIAMDDLKVLSIRNLDATKDLLIGAAVGTQLVIFANPASDIFIIPPKGRFLWESPLGGLDVSVNADLKFLFTGSGNLIYEIIAIGAES